MTLLLLLAALIPAARAATPAQAPAPIPSLAIERHTLANGLTVLLREDHASPVVAVNIWYNVGSKNEEPGRTGFAHLFEHYMFEGSAHVPGGEQFKEVFGMGGELNANTTNDRTDYYDVVPAENLEEVLRLESDRMGFLDINQRGLDKQRPIVKNEKRLRENKAYSGIEAGMDQTVWDAGHPYKWPVIGSMQDLDAASVADVKNFHDRYYLPNNAVIVVNGDQDNARTLALIEKWFGGIPAGATPPALRVPPTGPMTARREATIDDPKAQLPMLIMAFRIPGNDKPGWRESQVAAKILGGGRTSSLVQKLKYDRRMVFDIEADVEAQHEDDILIIDAIPVPGVSIAQVEAAIRAELDEFAQDGPTDREMARVKAGLRAKELNALQDAGDLAAAIAEGEGFHHDPEAVIHGGDAIMRMDKTAPRDAARRYLTRPNTAAIVIRPKPKAVPAPAIGGQP